MLLGESNDWESHIRHTPPTMQPWLVYSILLSLIYWQTTSLGERLKLQLTDAFPHGHQLLFCLTALWWVDILQSVRKIKQTEWSVKNVNLFSPWCCKGQFADFRFKQCFNLYSFQKFHKIDKVIASESSTYWIRTVYFFKWISLKNYRLNSVNRSANNKPMHSIIEQSSINLFSRTV